VQVPTLRAFLIILLAFATLAGCRRPDPPSNVRARAKAAAPVSTIQLRAEPVSEPFEQPPWIAHVKTVDLDRDGRLDIVYCEARDNKIVWLRQGELGGFTAITIAENMSAPVHVEAADMDGDGDLDLIVSSMGMVFPNNDRIGTVFVLENDGQQKFTPHTVIENTSRVVDAQAADLDGDGDIDLALAQFGYDQGEVTWLERTGPWEFRRHVILELSGAINVCVADFDGDSRPDIAALISQQWEEVYFFRNLGSGNFERNRVWGSTNEDYGSSGMSICDLNRDGRPDLLFSNGDGFGPAATPGPRPWHGVQWLENTGQGFFRYHRIGNLAGAYSPVGVDFDDDGDTDVIASSAYADWNSANRDVVSLMWFRNDGRMNFEAVTLAKVPRDLITLAAGDFDGSGRPTLVTGGFSIYPPFDDVSGVVIWRR
jgi:hypothetical protein